MAAMEEVGDGSASTNLGPNWIKHAKKSSKSSLTRLSALRRAMTELCDHHEVNRTPLESEILHVQQTAEQCEQEIHITL